MNGKVEINERTLSILEHMLEDDINIICPYISVSYALL